MNGVVWGKKSDNTDMVFFFYKYRDTKNFAIPPSPTHHNCRDVGVLLKQRTKVSSGCRTLSIVIISPHLHICVSLPI